MTTFNETVWADGFGIWHASVPITNSRHADALAARRDIVAAIAERSGPGFDPATVHVTRERITNHGTVIYQERKGTKWAGA